MTATSRSIVVVLICALIGGAVLCLAAPEPSLAPKSWELDFEFLDLQRISVVLPGDEKPTTCWYMLYTVTNNTSQDVAFYPSFVLVTDSYDTIEGGDGISPTVYDAVRKRYAKLYPFFVTPIKVVGKLLQGEDNAKTSAVVFRQFDASVDRFWIYVGGLSGEVVRVKNPAYSPDKGESSSNQRSYTLRKTLQIEYAMPGDEVTHETVKPARVGYNWVMR